MSRLRWLQVSHPPPKPEQRLIVFLIEISIVGGRNILWCILFSDKCVCVCVCVCLCVCVCVFVSFGICKSDWCVWQRRGEQKPFLRLSQ